MLIIMLYNHFVALSSIAVMRIQGYKPCGQLHSPQLFNPCGNYITFIHTDKVSQNFFI